VYRGQIQSNPSGGGNAIDFYRIYEVIFGRYPSAKAREALGALGRVGLAYGVARVLSFGTQVLVGRWMGETQYGFFTLVIAMVSLITIPAGIANGALNHYAPKIEDLTEKRSYVAGAFFIWLTALFCVLLAAILFAAPLSRVLRVPSSMWPLILFLTPAFAGWMFARSVLTALMDWNRYALAEVSWGVLALAGVAGAFFLFRDYRAVWGYMAAYFCVMFLAFPRVDEALRAGFSWVKLKELMHYAIYMSSFLPFGMVMAHLDKVLLNKSIGAEAVGIYQSHYMVTVGVMGLIGAFLVRFFFPYFSAGDKGDFWRLLKRASWLALPLPFLLYPVGLFGLSKVYKFTLSIPLLILFSLVALVQLLGWIYSAFLNSFGVKGVSANLKITLVSGVVNLVLLFLLIPIWGIMGAGLALGVAILLAFVVRAMMILRMVAEDLG